MEAKILKWQEPPPAKIVKPLDKPDAEVGWCVLHCRRGAGGVVGVVGVGRVAGGVVGVWCAYVQAWE